MSQQQQEGLFIQSGPYRLFGTLFLPADPGPHPVALLLHGMPGIEKNYDIAHALREQGWSSLIFHPRGAWGSGGPYRFRSQPDDVQAALDTLAHDPRLDLARLVLIGHSMGGWLAVLSALADPRPRAVAVYGALAEPREYAFDLAQAASYSEWFAGCTAEQLAADWAALDEAWSPVAQAHRLSPRPLLILHGEADEVIPVGHAHALYQAAREPKRLLLQPDADHGWNSHRPLLRQHLLRWLDTLAL